MPNRDPLIRHAITPPRFDRGKVHRERLVDSIHANMPRKLIAIAAPPGYGKTTLLADFGAHTELNVCWFRLGEADWDVMRFAEVLAASLQQRFRRLRGQPDLGALASASPEAIAFAFTSLIEERVAETFVIVIDDVHLINDSKPVLAFMDRFLETLPEQVTVVAAGREVLEVSLARLMAEGDLAGLGPHDLALNRDELVELSRVQFGAPLSEQEVNVLLDESRGWVTGVVMSGAISGGGIGAIVEAGRPMVYEYLASVVLNRQPDGLRRFALDSSVLPVMTANACDRVLERKDSQKLLARLSRKGLFIAATEGTPKTYEFHPLFRQFLQESLEGADPRRLRSLRSRAAAYLQEHGAPELAVGLYLDAGAPAKAAKLAEKQALRMYRQGHVQTLEVWAKRLEEKGAKAPEVLLYLADSILEKGDTETALEIQSRAQGMVSAKSKVSTRVHCEYSRGFIALYREEYAEVFKAGKKIEQLQKRRIDRRQRAVALRMLAWAHARHSRDYETAERKAAEAVEMLAATGGLLPYGIALMDLATFQEALGKPIQANATSDQAFRILRQHGAPYPLALAHNNRAYEAHRQGRFQDALEEYQEALKFARRAASPASEANTLLGQADLFNDLGMPLQAAELYGEALTIATQLDNVLLIQYGCIQTSVLHRRRGGIGLAREWLKRAMALQDRGSASVPTALQLAALECTAAPAQARDTLLKLLKGSDGNLEAGERVLAHYYRSKSALKLDDPEAASLAFTEALTAAGAAGEEQALAAELMHDPEMRAFAIETHGGDATLSVILSRIETMHGIAQQHEEIETPEALAERIKIIALGRSEIRAKDRVVAGMKPLTREILFYLIDHDRVTRDSLQETFWPDYPTGRQISNLHTAVYGIRRALGRETIQFDGAIYSLDPEQAILYDVARFEHAAGLAESLPRGDPRRMFALTEAVNLYRGAFLPELDSDWVIERRRMLEMRYLDLLAESSEEAMVRNQPAEAVQSLREALKLDPYRDDMNMKYLEALGQLGRRGELVAHYQNYVRLLSEELGLDPPEEIRQLYSRLIS